MLDFMLNIISSVFQMNMRDHHDIPFALPLVMAVILWFIIIFSILNFKSKEQSVDDRPEEQSKND